MQKLKSKIVEVDVESTATSNSTHATKIIRKKNNNLKQSTILHNFKSYQARICHCF